MALSIAQQISLIKGTVSPEAGSLKDFIHQIAVGVVTGMAESEIVFTVGETISLDGYSGGRDLDKAYAYQEKMKSFSQRVVSGADSTLLQMQKVVVSYMAEEGDYDALQSASDEVWAGLISAQIVKTFELLAVTSSDEATEYKALAAEL